MRAILTVIVFLSALTPTIASAGAWLREKGTGFSSTAFTITKNQDIANTTYLEYGLRQNLTLGADVRVATDSFGLQDGFATLFLRRSLGNPEKTAKWAYEVGVGATWDDTIMQPHVKAGLSWGRGLQLGQKSGWLAVDGSYRWDITAGQSTTKIDTTIGLGFTDITTGMLQLYLSEFQGNTSATLAPSLVLQPRGRKFRVQVGAEAPLDGTDDTALKLGLWREF